MALFSQNLNNVQFASNNMVNQLAMNYNSFANDNDAPSQISNNGGLAALNRSSNKNKLTPGQTNTKKVVKTNSNPTLQVSVVNTLDNNNENTINHEIKTNTNPDEQYTVFHTANNKPNIKVDSPIMDFTPSGLSGRDYSNGGKLKKGQKNFAKIPKTKNPKHKSKPRHVKVKYHTSQCARW